MSDQHIPPLRVRVSTRYKYENNRVVDVSSPDVSSPLHYQLYGNGKIGVDVPSKGTQNQLLERQVVFYLSDGSLSIGSSFHLIY